MGVSPSRHRQNLSVPQPLKPAATAAAIVDATKEAALMQKFQRECQKSILLSLVESKALELSHVRRMALFHSIQRDDGDSTRQMMIEAVMDAPTISPYDKDRIYQLLLQDRLDFHSALTDHPVPFAHGTEWNKIPACPTGDVFLDFRRMILALFRTSRKFQTLPVESRQRVKAMILKTRHEADLAHLLARIMARTCGDETMKRIQDDVIVTGRFYRLLLPDRFDCDEGSSDQKISADRVESETFCPICMDPVNGLSSAPVQLDCRHVFCRRCLDDWIRQQQQQQQQRNGTTSYKSRNANNQLQNPWDCPLCRHTYHSLR